MSATATVPRIELATAVDRVTVLEDRAVVIRCGSVSLEAGPVRLRISGVSPVLADRTLAVKIEGPAPTRMDDARVTREVVLADADSSSAVAELETRARAHQVLAAQTAQRRGRCVLRVLSLDRILEATYKELAQDASWGRLVAGEWDGRLDALEESRTALDLERLQIEDEERRLGEEGALLHARLAAAQSPSSTRRASVEVDLTTSASGPYTVEVTYVVPGACWRPAHRARLSGTNLTFTTEACLWQNTGEDWVAAKLSFSTQRPTLGTEPPVLVDDLLSGQPRPREDVIATREEVIQTVGLGGGGPQSSDMPGIDDGGQVQLLKGLHPLTVHSDGRPHRVPVGSFQTTVTPELVATPELSPSVFVRTEQVHSGASPLLAGPVELVRDSGPVGRTTLLFIAPGERFELGWGPEPDLRIHREHAQKEEGPGILSSWISVTHTITLKLSNLGTRIRNVRIQERIPVSEVEKVRVAMDVKGTSPVAVPPDEHGRITWNVTLPPRGRERLGLVWTLQKHKDLIGI